jgi:ABC-type branched-subunit amino acid transport system substrate-binding protein
VESIDSASMSGRPRNATLAIVVVALAGCGKSEEPQERDASGRGAAINLRIGALIPLSGDQAVLGPPSRKAAQLALERIDKAIAETASHDRVKLQHRDERTTAEEAQSAARELVDEGAACLIGPFASAATVAVADAVSIPDRILQISPAATGDEISDLSDEGLVNRTVLPDSAQGPALAHEIADDLGGASEGIVNVATSNDVHGVGLSKSFADAWDAAGGNLGEEVVYDPDQADYEDVAARIVSGDPDAVVIVDTPATFARLGPALAGTAFWDPAIAWATNDLVRDGLGRLTGLEVVGGMRATGPGAPAAGRAVGAFDRQPFAAQSFDAVILCYLAAVAAGSTDGAEMAAALRDVTSPEGARYTWRQLPAAIEALRDGADIDFQGASGPIDLDDNGDPTVGTYLLYRYERGGPEAVGEVSVDRSED